MSGRGRKAFDKKIIQASFTGHLTGLPQDILALFHPSPLLQYIKLAPINKRKFNDLGLACYTQNFEKLIFMQHSTPNGKKFVNKEYRYQVRFKKTFLEIIKRREQECSIKNKNACKMAPFDPMNDPNVEGDPFKTLFVARLSYCVTERELWKNFEEYGTLSRVRIITDKLSGKHRGYGFIEFVHAEHMKLAYKSAMNRNIRGRPIIVDVERGRTVSGWRPRRLGGGIGGESRLTRHKSLSDTSATVASTHCARNLNKKSTMFPSRVCCSQSTAKNFRKNGTSKNVVV
eukprot:gnl/TRDRNA2_/TRDRNA2_177618_c0_seq2.p1 gnl/TRDRNA2_/TRDRNA2_177618_c0~~gnl/TRDRNA2_/TRDRNA2_177618_c0_seq2.p1  ORF type:complete len:287 (+),score=-18.93 gnl/TRDRNA2_/TRDRNA2_177618_c0_seq2:525-1385(+)